MRPRVPTTKEDRSGAGTSKRGDDGRGLRMRLVFSRREKGKRETTRGLVVVRCRIGGRGNTRETNRERMGPKEKKREWPLHGQIIGGEKSDRGEARRVIRQAQGTVGGRVGLSRSGNRTLARQRRGVGSGKANQAPGDHFIHQSGCGRGQGQGGLRIDRRRQTRGEETKGRKGGGAYA